MQGEIVHRKQDLANIEFSDDEFVKSFEENAQPNEMFNHIAHIRLAWIYIQRHPLPHALGRLWEGLRQFAAKNGQEDRFNETLTIFFTLLVYQRSKNSNSSNWREFSDANSDLLDFKKVVAKFYFSESLRTETAKKSFVFPDFNPDGLQRPEAWTLHD
jgi:hypothetical protein